MKDYEKTFEKPNITTKATNIEVVDTSIYGTDAYISFDFIDKKTEKTLFTARIMSKHKIPGFELDEETAGQWLEDQGIECEDMCDLPDHVAYMLKQYTNEYYEDCLNEEIDYYIDEDTLENVLYAFESDCLLYNVDDDKSTFIIDDGHDNSEEFVMYEYEPHCIARAQDYAEKHIL